MISLAIVVDHEDGTDEIATGYGETDEIALERAYADLNTVGEALIAEYGFRIVRC